MNIASIVKLIKKDLQVFRRYYLSISMLMLVMGMCIIVANTNMQQIFAGSGSSIAIIAIYTFMLDRKSSSTWMHIASLPVSRIEMNTARFISVFIISTANLLLWVLCYDGMLYFVVGRPEQLASASVILFAFMHMLLYVSLYFIFYYRVHNIAIILVYIIPVFALNFINPSESSFSEYIMEDGMRFWVFCGGCLVLYLGSYAYSNHYFKNKSL